MKNKLLQFMKSVMYFSLFGIILQTFCMQALLAAPANDQESRNAKEIFLSVEFNNLNILEAFELIESKTNYQFRYKSEEINSEDLIDFKVSNSSLAEILVEISKVTQLSFQQVNNTIEVKMMDNIEQHDAVSLETFIQTRTINGKVTGEDTEGLPGVNVIEKGTSNGTVTDLDGSYSLEVSAEAVLVFSSVGYTTEEVAVGNRTVIDLTMVPDIQQLEELVVVGYGTQERRSLTGSVASVESEVLQESKVPNATQLLQGRIPGVITKQSSGLPGQDNANFSIRGFGNPLVLVDGMERNLSNVNPNEIESISVLKDASAAIYGARSGNGVILVTTKRGIKGKPQFSYDGNYSVQQFTKKPEVITDAGIYAEFWNESEENIGVATTYTAEEIQNYKDGIEGYESYDWYDFALQKWTPMQQHNLSVNGGSDVISYFAGMGYTNQESVIASDDFFYRRYNLRSNVNANITDNFSASVDFDFTNEFQRKVPQEDGNDVNTMMRGIYKSQPMAPTTFPDTSLIPASNLQGTHNRLYGNMFEDIGGKLDLNRNIFTANLFLDYKIPGVQGLSTNFRLIYRINDLRETRFQKAFPLHQRDPDTGEYIPIGTFGANNKNLLNIRDREFSRIKPIFQINYKRELENHSIDGSFIAEYIGENTDQIQAQTENLLSDELPYLNFGDPVFHRLDQFVLETGTN